MKAAFYKGTRPGLKGIYSRAVRWIDRGPDKWTPTRFIKHFSKDADV